MNESFGVNNALIKKFGHIADIDTHGVEPFLKVIITLAQLFELPSDTVDKTSRNIDKLKSWLANEQIACSDVVAIKMLRYLDMFLTIL